MRRRPPRCLRRLRHDPDPSGSPRLQMTRTLHGTVRITTAQALVRWVVAQRSELLDGTEVPLFAGVFGIFGHGNVLGLGTALYAVRDVLPTWRGNTEEGMALAAIGFGKAMDRRQVMVATSSIGPGALNMVTAAGVAHANRIPVLLLPGDTFQGRAPDPVLQQIESFVTRRSPSMTPSVRSAGTSIDRQAGTADLDPSPGRACPHRSGRRRARGRRAATGRADRDVRVSGGDVRAEAPPGPPPGTGCRALAEAADILRSAHRPLIIIGGGVRYSGAGRAVLAFAERHGIPLADTPAGRTLVPHGHPLYAGPLGIVGSRSANRLAAEADVVLAIGTRLEDFTTSSWTVLARTSVSSRSTPRDSMRSSTPVTPSWVTLWSPSRPCESPRGMVGRRGMVGTRGGRRRRGTPMSTDCARRPEPRGDYLCPGRRCDHDLSGPEDYILTSAGGLPGELHGGWRTGVPGPPRGTAGATMDLEYGLSCMGYEISVHGGRRWRGPRRTRMVCH